MKNREPTDQQKNLTKKQKKTRICVKMGENKQKIENQIPFLFTVKTRKIGKNRKRCQDWNNHFLPLYAVKLKISRRCFEFLGSQSEKMKKKSKRKRAVTESLPFFYAFNRKRLLVDRWNFPKSRFKAGGLKNLNVIVVRQVFSR